MENFFFDITSIFLQFFFFTSFVSKVGNYYYLRTFNKTEFSKDVRFARFNKQDITKKCVRKSKNCLSWSWRSEQVWSLLIRVGFT